jgi:hypothetical protein
MYVRKVKITIIKGRNLKLKHSNTNSPVWGMAAVLNCPLTPAGNIYMKTIQTNAWSED